MHALVYDDIVRAVCKLQVRISYLSGTSPHLFLLSAFTALCEKKGICCNYMKGSLHFPALAGVTLKKAD